MHVNTGNEKAPHGAEIFGHPLLNKDAAFTARSGTTFGLRGLLPWRVATLDEQVALELEHLRGKKRHGEVHRADGAAGPERDAVLPAAE